MPFWLAPPGSGQQRGFLKRFDARFWTVNFPRPMMAAATTIGARALRVDATFHGSGDLAGLIWEAGDRFDHPLCAYETSRDFRSCVLSFRWRSGGLKPLDELHGPTLTIEGRDAEGNPRAWYVRLWNYASGSPENAEVRIDFAAVDGGFLLPAEADPVWAADIDRMFISLASPAYDAGATPFGAAAAGWAELTDIGCEGAGSVLTVGETLVPEHRLRVATGYDDLYHLTPARLLGNILQLGYRRVINHYVGMSHYFTLGADLRVAPGLNVACAAWHRDFLTRAAALGCDVILSLSYELLAQHCPEAWQQRAADGTPALTGWMPPSALLSPANGAAMAWLQDIARGFVTIAIEAGVPVRFQVGEPWWWVRADGTICLYDAAAAALFSPAPITNVRDTLNAAQKTSLDAAGAVLAESTAALCQAVRDAAPGAECLLLAYLPTVLDGAEARRANLPSGWASPAFDVLQLEDYDWVTSGNRGASLRGLAAATERLGYPAAEQHYLAGFVLRAEDKAQWSDIASAAQAAFERGTAEVFVWALPQVLRDGFTWFEIGERQVEPFADELFPIAIGRAASVETEFSTAIVTTAGGAEQRNSDWADARMRFDAGPGVRGEEELAVLTAFFRARRGPAQAFRFRDPFDWSSGGIAPQPADQLIGTGDGVRTEFPLRKLYGDQERRITRPVAGSVRVAVAGVERLVGWTIAAGGVVQFDIAPAAGETVFAGFLFDVPVRFAEDRLEVSRVTFAAGEAPSVPLIEVRE